MTVSPSAVLKTALTAAILHDVFVVGLPALIFRRTFGEGFDDYCRDVPRWIPRPRRASRRRGSG